MTKTNKTQTNSNIKAEIARIEKALATIEKFRAIQPAGSLNISKSAGRIRFRHRLHLGGGIYKTEYLKSGNKLIVQLVTKKYYNKLYPILKKELRSLKNQEAIYFPDKKYKAYSELGELKKYVKPLFIDDGELKAQMIEESIKAWFANTKQGSGYREEGKRIETDDGNYVRSKSESLIYNYLLKNSDRLYFMYEPEVYISSNGYPIHPDFAIISKATGESYLWEHAGMIGFDEYSTNFVHKMNSYYKAGYFPGEKLILTVETAEAPIDMAVVKQIVKKYFPSPTL